MRFIRKNGRIIPIRDKKMMKRIGYGAAAIAAPLVAGFAGGKLANASVRTAKTTATFIKQASKAVGTKRAIPLLNRANSSYQNSVFLHKAAFAMPAVGGLASSYFGAKSQKSDERKAIAAGAGAAGGWYLASKAMHRFAKIKVK